MNSNTFSWRRFGFTGFAAWLIIIALGVFYLFFGTSAGKKDFGLNVLRQKVHLGIDLVGGTYLTLIVQTDQAVKAELEDRLETIARRIKTDRKALMPVTKEVRVVKAENVRALIPQESSLVLSFKTAADAQEAMSFLSSEYRNDVAAFDEVLEGEKLILRLKDEEARRIATDAVRQDRDVLAMRLNQEKSNVSEISVSIHGEKSIAIELPDVSNPQAAERMIGTPAALAFKIVSAADENRDNLLYKYDGNIPDGMEIIRGSGEDTKFYLVTRRAAVTGKHLKDARPTLTDKGYGVSFTLTRDGGDLFYELTKNNVGNLLGVVLDNKMITVAEIHDKLRSEVQITGHFDMQRADELAKILKSGAFSAPVSFDERRRIEPTLGKEAVNSGLLSCLVSLILLLIFTIVFYSWSGILAFITLLLNLFLLLIGLVWLEATLTLPGIAGMILTIGMAVDASVLIYEHIREQLAAGVPVKKAVNDGFSGAFRVIWDANITTLLAAVILYKFGSGPIQGFAVTMMLGIASTLLTGLLFLRATFSFILDNFTVHKLRI